MFKTTEIPEGARLGAALPETHDDTRCGMLCCVKPGGRARVRAVGGEPMIRRRLLEMGFVSGTAVRVVRLAPLGDPMQVELHGYHISLRRTEAQAILVAQD